MDFTLSLDRNDMRNNNLKWARKRIIEFHFPNGDEVRLNHRDRDHIDTIEEVLFGRQDRREIDQAIDQAYLRNPKKFQAFFS